MATRSSGSRSKATVNREALQSRIDSITREFSQMGSWAQFAHVHEAIGRIEEYLSELPLELKAVECRGYLHSGPLHERLEFIDAAWEKAEP